MHSSRVLFSVRPQSSICSQLKGHCVQYESAARLEEVTRTDTHNEVIGVRIGFFFVFFFLGFILYPLKTRGLRIRCCQYIVRRDHHRAVFFRLSFFLRLNLSENKQSSVHRCFLRSVISPHLIFGTERKKHAPPLKQGTSPTRAVRHRPRIYFLLQKLQQNSPEAELLESVWPAEM